MIMILITITIMIIILISSEGDGLCFWWLRPQALLLSWRGKFIMMSKSSPSSSLSLSPSSSSTCCSHGGSSALITRFLQPALTGVEGSRFNLRSSVLFHIGDDRGHREDWIDAMAFFTSLHLFSFFQRNNTFLFPRGLYLIAGTSKVIAFTIILISIITSTIIIINITILAT